MARRPPLDPVLTAANDALVTHLLSHRNHVSGPSADRAACIASLLRPLATEIVTTVTGTPENHSNKENICDPEHELILLCQAQSHAITSNAHTVSEQQVGSTVRSSLPARLRCPLTTTDLSTPSEDGSTDVTVPVDIHLWTRMLNQAIRIDGHHDYNATLAAATLLMQLESACTHSASVLGVLDSVFAGTARVSALQCAKMMRVRESDVSQCDGVVSAWSEFCNCSKITEMLAVHGVCEIVSDSLCLTQNKDCDHLLSALALASAASNDSLKWCVHCKCTGSVHAHNLCAVHKECGESADMAIACLHVADTLLKGRDEGVRVVARGALQLSAWFLAACTQECDLQGVLCALSSVPKEATQPGRPPSCHLLSAYPCLAAALTNDSAGPTTTSTLLQTATNTLIKQTHDNLAFVPDSAAAARLAAAQSSAFLLPTILLGKPSISRHLIRTALHHPAQTTSLLSVARALQLSDSASRSHPADHTSLVSIVLQEIVESDAVPVTAVHSVIDGLLGTTMLGSASLAPLATPLDIVSRIALPLITGCETAGEPTIEHVCLGVAVVQRVLHEPQVQGTIVVLVRVACALAFALSLRPGYTSSSHVSWPLTSAALRTIDQIRDALDDVAEHIWKTNSLTVADRSTLTATLAESSARLRKRSNGITNESILSLARLQEWCAHVGPDIPWTVRHERPYSQALFPHVPDQLGIIARTTFAPILLTIFSIFSSRRGWADSLLARIHDDAPIDSHAWLSSELHELTDSAVDLLKDCTSSDSTRPNDVTNQLAPVTLVCAMAVFMPSATPNEARAVGDLCGELHKQINGHDIAVLANLPLDFRSIVSRRLAGVQVSCAALVTLSRRSPALRSIADSLVTGAGSDLVDESCVHAWIRGGGGESGRQTLTLAMRTFCNVCQSAMEWCSEGDVSQAIGHVTVAYTVFTVSARVVGLFSQDGDGALGVDVGSLQTLLLRAAQEVGRIRGEFVGTVGRDEGVIDAVVRGVCQMAGELPDRVAVVVEPACDRLLCDDV